MKKYLYKYWSAGFHYEPAIKDCIEFLNYWTKKCKSFEVVSLAVQPERKDLQNITLVYSVDEDELKEIESQE